MVQELRFTADCLTAEPKNYHAWAHGQAVLVAADAAAAAAAGSGRAAPDPAQRETRDAVSPSAAASGGDAADAANAQPAPAADGLGTGSGTDTGTRSGGSLRGMWEAELEFVALHIREDVRNNSAWAQRFFVLRHRCAQLMFTKQCEMCGPLRSE